MTSPRSAWIASLFSLVLGLAVCGSAAAQVEVFAQQPNPSGGLEKSAWLPPDGLDGDQYCWDDFTLPSSQTLTTVRWRGGYIYSPSGTGHSPLIEFTIAIYPSIGGGSQPDVVGPPLVQYTTGGNAGETPAGSYGGYAMFDYSYTLPSPFPAAGGTKYWLQIYASCGAQPDWGWTYGTGGDGKHFRAITGGTGGGGTLYQAPSPDLAFALDASSGPSHTIAASASPPAGGTISGAGSYPFGSLAALTAIPNAGYGFSNWTEAATVVSTSATYSFVVTADRTLVANFVPAWTVTTAPLPFYAGATSGGGIYDDGASVTVIATPVPGFHFLNWSGVGGILSTSPTYVFPATMDQPLTANFEIDANGAAFDFDTAWPTLFAGQGVPVSQTANGVTLYASSPQGSAFSLQNSGSTFWVMPLFGGLWLCDNNLNPNQLDLHFSRALTDITFNFATADFNQAELTSPVQMDAYTDAGMGTLVGSANTRGAYIGGTMPAGTMSFHSGTPFAFVRVWMPGCPTCSSDFFVDNIVTSSSQVTAVDPSGAGPGLRLAAAPNPFRSGTTLEFSVPRRSHTRLAVYDLAGRQVRELWAGPLGPGDHSVSWTGLDERGDRVPAGLYFVRLEADGRGLSLKTMLVR